MEPTTLPAPVVYSPMTFAMSASYQTGDAE